MPALVPVGQRMTIAAVFLPPLHWLLLARIVLVAPQGPAETPEGRVIHISDGDTLSVLADGWSQVKVRSARTDAPERGSPSATAPGSTVDARWSPCVTTERDHLRALLPRLDPLAPPAHELAPFGEVLGAVVCGANAIALEVGQLSLDDVRLEAGLVQHGGRQGAESVGGRTAVVAHPVEGIEKGVRGRGAPVVTTPREEEGVVAGELPKLLQRRVGLGREGHDVRRPHLHPIGRDAPLGGFSVELLPLCGS